MRFLIGLALAQLRHHAARWALLVLGVALVVVVPVLTSGLARSVDAHTISRTVFRLDLTERTLLVSQEADTTTRRGTRAANDRAVRRALADLTPARVVRELLYRPIADAGVTFLLGGTDDLAHSVTVTSGRLPRRCTPTRCETVVLGEAPDGLARAARSIGVVVVGTARRTSPVLATGPLDPGRTPLLLADGADAAGRVDALSLFSHYYAWAAPVSAGRIVDDGVDGWVRNAETASARLDETVGGTTLATPADALQDAAGRARASTRRLDLLGGFTGVLLVGFAVLAAAGLRRENDLLATTLRRRGATPAQTATVTGVQVLFASVSALVVGVLAGAVVVAARWSDGTGLSALGAAQHATGDAALSVVLLAAGAAVVVGAVLLWPATRPQEVWRVLDVLAVAALGAVVLAADRGTTNAGDLDSGGDPLVIALPVLAAVAAGIVAARLWRPAVLLLDRLTGSRFLSLRLALVGAVRRPLRPSAGVAFLAAAVAAVVFTGTYRATLLANDDDQAAYQVPLDVTLSGTIAAPVPSVPSDALGADDHAFGVLRTAASVPSVPGAATAATLIAPVADALPFVRRWSRTTGSDRSAASVAALLRTATPTAPTLPGRGELQLPVAGFNANTVVSLWVRGRSGAVAQVALAVHDGLGSARLPDLGGGRLTVSAFGVGPTVDFASHRAHGLGEGTTDRRKLAGALTVGAPTVDGRGVPWSWDGWGSATSRVTGDSGTLRVTYALGNQVLVSTPHFDATRSLVLPVVTDPATAAAAHGGQLQITLDAPTTLTVRVVATMPRMPSVDGAFLLADLTTLRTLLDRTEPGRAVDQEWLTGRSPTLRRFLAHTPLTVTDSAAIEHELDTDPIGRGTRTLLVIVAALALAASAVALMLLVLGERRDSTGELYAWEADGVAPATLRRTLGLRALLVAAVGVPVGVAAGVAVALAGTRLVAVDATGTTPTPPIELASGGAGTVLALTAGVGLGLLAGAAVAATSLRERLVRPPEADLR